MSSSSLSRHDLEALIFGTEGGKRYTQDSPILPDVWLAFGADPWSPQDLLLTPHWNTDAGRLGQVLRQRLAKFRQQHAQKRRSPAAIAAIQGNVAVTLYFDELIQVVLPMTPWWRQHVAQKLQPYQAPVPPQVTDLVNAIADFPRRVPQDSLHFLWLLQLVGAIAWAQQAQAKPQQRQDARPTAAELASAGLAALLAAPLTAAQSAPEDQTLVWLINRNRTAALAVQRSTLAVKADAARRLFDVSCRNITWAVIDSGIDAAHPAFQDHSKPGANRIIKAYDFSQVRELLAADNLTERALTDRRPHLAKAFEHPVNGKTLRRQLQTLKRDLNTGREVDWELLKPFLEAPAGGDSDKGWKGSDHGTHVAGILAADWRQSDSQPEDDASASAGPATDAGRQGMCPDIRLYDLRVLNSAGQGDEFSVIAALQFIRHLNAQRDYIVIHGANLSLSIQHDVANYACGRTPVCEECERLVASGVVVVAAAGNQGFLRYQTERGLMEGYHTVSITDPGNAEGVITVGATHRYQAHTYGVSYFSSRGPTGDGRRKPDLVAPGEKIRAPVPGGVDAFKDGTSMAAPHVSGAAAMLMARHTELIGQPGRIKRILCENATDLGREPYFQGGGMLDVLRALQAV